MDWLNLLAVQGTLKSLLQHHSSKASILQCSAFFTVQLSHPYMTTGKTIALTRWTFVGKVISHGCTCVPHPEPPSHLPPHPIPLVHASAPALSTLSHASNLDWQSVSHMIIYMFQCSSLKSSYPCLFPQNPKDCSIHLCLFCCLAYRVIVTIFLNSIYIH